ncbi:metallophosphoesterase [Microbulbifer elongatus]|uniref:Metallophosphoesterase n=1 Tax=Microbulbifer elongatus TaxID=86173 RepID=A0ABT1NXC9_9GAMM|nr:metallophosphoesterase [Microbulbifer elongatus]MCQ3828456.1 metallophosphoesterase [Microbulbifer elongatus]
MPIYRKISHNHTGRDFVVGDVHGHLKQLQKQLDALSFDPGSDRLFCVGDVIDRGPDSRAMLDFIDQKTVFSILGNHEAMMIAGFESPADVQLHFSNGGEWFYDLNRSEQSRLVDKVRQWPWAIEIDTGQGTAGLVHADVPESSWKMVQKLTKLASTPWAEGAPMSEPRIAAAAQPLLWNRGLIQRLYKNVLGLDRSKITDAEYEDAFRQWATKLADIDSEQSRPFHISGIGSVYLGHSYVPVETPIGNCHFLDTFRGEQSETLSLSCASKR